MNLENPAGRNAVAYVIAVVIRNLLVAEHCSGVVPVKAVCYGVLQGDFIGSGLQQQPQYLVVLFKFLIGFLLVTVQHHRPVVVVSVAAGIAAEFSVTTSLQGYLLSAVQAFAMALVLIVFHRPFQCFAQR